MARLMRHTRHVEEEFPTVIRLSSVLAATDPPPRERRHALYYIYMFVTPFMCIGKHRESRAEAVMASAYSRDEYRCR